MKRWREGPAGRIRRASLAASRRKEKGERRDFLVPAWSPRAVLGPEVAGSSR